MELNQSPVTPQYRPTATHPMLFVHTIDQYINYIVHTMYNHTLMIYPMHISKYNTVITVHNTYIEVVHNIIKNMNILCQIQLLDIT